jgi:3-oxoacyl-[acyl-carrier-protein] synthase II
VTDPASSGRGCALITGAGAVTPLGIGVENFWDASLHGKSGIGEITLFDPSPYPSRIAGECSDFDPTDFMTKKQAAGWTRFAQLGVAQASRPRERRGRGGHPEDARAGPRSCSAAASGGLSTWEREYRVLEERGPGGSARSDHDDVPNMAAGQLAILLGAHGPSQCPVLACATGGEAIAEGWS